MNKFTYEDFYNQWRGQSSSLGGNYNQCVTLFKEFLNKAGYPSPERAIGGSGGAREIWYRKDALGYGDYFEYTQVGQPGDWFIWDSVYGWWQGVYYGHVAMLIKDNGNGTGQFLGMNQDYSQAPASVQTLTYNGSCGVLRYKGYGSASQTTSTFDTSQLIAENAVATFTVDKLNARVNSPTGTVCRQYNTGDSVEYSYKWVGNGHRYICWYEGSNIIMVAISESEDYSSTRWATISTKEAASTDSLEDEHGFAKYKVDGVNLRKDSVTGDVVKVINTGDVIEYTQKCVTNGHRYISYVDGDTRYYIACSPTEEKSTEWCDFYAENPSTNTTEEKKEETKPNYTANVKGYGIDLSEHNADVDVSKYDFVIIRCAWGENTDKLFESYVEKCEKANVPYGVYLYDYALDDSQAQAEADYCLNLIKGKNIQMGVWFDMEDADGYKKKKGILNAERCTKSCDIFCKALKEKGYYVGIYCSSSWIGNYVTTTDYPFWIANWGTNDGTIQSDQSSKAVMHQYTSNPLDLDVIYHDVDFFKSNPKSDTDESKKDDTNTPSDTDSSNTDSSTESKIDTDKANTLIALLIKLVKKLLNIFK